jgi:F-type H+-transporting ATPase subunit a
MSSEGVNFLSNIVPDHNLQAIIGLIAISGGLGIAGMLATKNIETSKIKNARVEETSIEELERLKVIPISQVTLFSVADLVIEGFIKFQDSVLGGRKRDFLPLFGTYFFVILIANFFGLIPGMPPITSKVSVTAGLALSSFIYFNYSGIREHGVGSYLKHFAGPKLSAWFFLISAIIFVIEISGAFLRILTLNLRLYWNINADHSVVSALTELFGIGAIVVYPLGAFVCLMQAFVFTTLSMVYVLLATAHSEEH